MAASKAPRALYPTRELDEFERSNGSEETKASIGGRDSRTSVESVGSKASIGSTASVGSEGSKVSEESEDSEASVRTESSMASGRTAVSDASEMSGLSKITEASGQSKITEASGQSKITEASGQSKITEASGQSKITETSGHSITTEASRHSKILEGLKDSKELEELYRRIKEAAAISKEKNAMMLAPQDQKSLAVAYLLWLLGGVFGLHLLYLRRDKQAFIYWASFCGLLGCGVLRDFVRLPAYVRDYNNDPDFVEELVKKMRRRKKPSLSPARMFAQMCVGNIWHLLMYAAVPDDWTLMGYPVKPIGLLLSPLASALAVWLIGNIGRERGTLKWALIGSYLSLLLVPFLGIQGVNWCPVLSTLFFNKLSKQWRRTPYVRYSTCRRGSSLCLAWLVFSMLFCSFLYHNATIETKGEKIKFRDAIGHFLRSPMFLEFKNNAWQLCGDISRLGLRDAWTNFIDLMDPTGRKHALKILELPQNATQQMIKQRVRDQSKLWHPDKHSGEEEKAAAQQKFMEIQEASDILLDSKKRRRKSNSKNVVEDA